MPASRSAAIGGRAVPLFTAATATGAALLFLVQPMFARMLLPHLGSSPVVWSTALVCYQGGLLVGYLYAHLSTTRLGVRRQAALHVLLLLLAGLSLPVALRPGAGEPALDFPVPWLVATMALSIGAPYVALASTSPVLQRWLAGTGLSGAGDPYFLYAASNAGSFAALLAYPLLVEPALGLVAQGRLWSAGYGLLLLLTGLCAAALWRAPARSVPAGSAKAGTSPGVSWRARGRWLLLAALPAALLVSVTAHIAADVAAVPLLWVVPLAVYLLTYVLAFSRYEPATTRTAAQVLPFAVVPLAVAIGARATQPALPLLTVHLAGLAVLAAVCHGRLAALRPAPARLTEFYLLMSLGGVLGGAFAALLAPVLFSTLAEYPVALVLALIVAYRPSAGATPAGGRAVVLDVGLPALLGLLAAGLLWRSRDATLTGNPLALALVFGPLALILLTFRRRPLRLGLGVGSLLVASALLSGGREGVVLEQRSFFGVHRVRRVELAPGETYHVLVHGSTVHGVQRRDAGLETVPQAYYAGAGPVGQVFGALDLGGAGRPVAVVGLGAGGLACHGAAGQPWRFHEIDPVVGRIAADARYFSFLRDCPPTSDVVLGDGRLTLARSPDGRYGAIVLDAYSSDAIPVHLLTREAVALYLRKLTPDGVLLFHISSRHLDLAPVLGALAADARLVARVRTDGVAPAAGATPSRWAVLARREADLGALRDDPRWEPAPDPGPGLLWTDDYASVVRVLRLW